VIVFHLWDIPYNCTAIVSLNARDLLTLASLLPCVNFLMRTFTMHISISFCGATPPLEPRPLIVEVSKSPTIGHTQPVGILLTSDQPVAVAIIITTHNKLKTPTFMLSAGSSIPAVKGLLNHALDHMASEVVTLQIAE